jgi:type III secretion protein J
MSQPSIVKKGLGLCLFFLLAVTACGKETVYQDLDERDANEILVVLFKSGIDAEKLRVEGAQEVAYSILVPKDKIQEARRILVENNLPRKKQLGFSGICQEKGLIPTPEEEKCRKLLALKGEIINSLERVPGVIDADVVLNIPEISEFADEEAAKKHPTASAVIRVKKDEAGPDLREGNVQRFISNTVENLDPRDVTVIISFVEPPQKIIAKGPQAGGPGGQATAGGGAPAVGIAGLNVSQNSLQRFKIYAIVFLAVLIGISSALILNVIKLTRMRQELKVSRAHGAAGGPALLEGGGQGPTPQLQSGEGQKAETPVH